MKCYFNNKKTIIRKLLFVYLSLFLLLPLTSCNNTKVDSASDNKETFITKRSECESDEQYANFRMVKMGDIKEERLFRSSSPFENNQDNPKKNRATYSAELAMNNNIHSILDLADTNLYLESIYDGMNEKSKELYASSKIVAININYEYRNKDSMRKIIEGLTRLSGLDAPYLIHCVEGKDRTGFVCALLECLCEGTYSEIVDDYMKTYENYYDVNKDNNPSYYDDIKTVNIDDMLKYICDDKDVDLNEVNLRDNAINFLLKNGMNNANIETLINKLCD